MYNLNSLFFFAFIFQCLFSIMEKEALAYGPVGGLIHLDNPPLIQLPPMCASLDDIAITGFSSGAAHSIQYHVSNSMRIKKVGIIAGGPYSWAEGRKRVDFFVEANTIDTRRYINRALQLSNNGEIDNVRYLAGSKVYVYHGTKDTAVNIAAGYSIVDFYNYYRADIAANVGQIRSEHGIPAKDSGGPCGTPNIHEYYVQNCSYNGIYHMFNHLYGPSIIEPLRNVGTVRLLGTFAKFNQTEFLPPHDDLSMDDVGYIYIPSNCHPCRTRCRVAFIFHGCTQNRILLGRNFAVKSGFLEMAELNNIISIFPVVKISPRNPQGCWDFLGYTGDDFFKKSGKQSLATDRMVNRVLSHYI